jgi:cellulose synthase/poly-beta-1,6-N-acetylglucosamine synthase-like glycosyltransferase
MEAILRITLILTKYTYTTWGKTVYTLSESLFWIIIALVLYVYFGYQLFLLILGKLRTALLVKKSEITPTVSLIIATYNEENVIAQKIENCLALDYPQEKLEIIVASDGSTDRTNEIVKGLANQGVKLVALSSNHGKSSAQNRAIAETSGDILLFTDADVMLGPDVVNKVIRNFADESVGCVVGKIAYLNEDDTSVSEGEGVYWRYELLLRDMESEVGNFAMGSGIMAIRRSLFRPIDPNVGEDFVLPMQTAMAGHRVVYEPEAIAETILNQTKPKDMLRSKVRVISKDLRGLFLCRSILNPFRYPLYALGLISHKLLRWLVPYFLIALLIDNLVLSGHPFYYLTLALQIAFYTLALAGYLWQKKGKPPRILGILFSFCLVNLAALVGVARFVMGKQAGQWEPVRS